MKHTDRTSNIPQSSRNLKKIWDERKSVLGLTQAQAGERLGMTVAAINQYLHGKTVLGIKAIFKWANLLGVQPEDIDPEINDKFKIDSPIQFGASSDRTLPMSDEEIDWVIILRRIKDRESRQMLFKMAAAID